MSRADIMILCEDKVTDDFFCDFFMAYYDWSLSRTRRVVRRSNYPKGRRGAGEKHVRDAYAKELQAYRKNPQGRMLVAVIDADSGTVDAHHRELDYEARQDSIGGPRKMGEAVIHVVPKRSIETWIAYFSGEQADEERTFRDKYRGKRDKIRDAAKKLAHCCKADQACDSQAPDSLQQALKEFQRFKDNFRT
jgi:hypothetical protein